MGTNPAHMPSRRELLWLAEEKTCHWCGRPTRLISDDVADQATIDHIKPRYKGGTNDVSNIVSSCRSCNARRNSEDIKGLPEGALIQGWSFKGSGQPQPNGRKPDYYKHIALTADEKKALLTRVALTPVKMTPQKTAEDVLREQRDQAHKALNVALVQRDQAKQEALELRKELKHYEAAVKAQEQRIEHMTIREIVRKRIVKWLKMAVQILDEK